MESIESINGQHYSTHCISHSLDNLWIQIDFQFRRRQTNLCDICCCLFLSFFIYLFIDRLVDARCRCVNFQTKTSLDLRHLVGVERKSSPPHTHRAFVPVRSLCESSAIGSAVADRFVLPSAVILFSTRLRCALYRIFVCKQHWLMPHSCTRNCKRKLERERERESGEREVKLSALHCQSFCAKAPPR